MDDMASKHTRLRWKVILGASAVLVASFVFVIVKSRQDGSAHPSAPNKPAVAERTEVAVVYLEIKSVVQHGDIYEIVGSAEPGSSVMINGQYAPLVFENSTFKYFVGPLPNGVTVLTVTVQNEYGGVDTKQLALTGP
jgi:hypothetical protein